jgi:ribosomal protein S18 acetylase RimI-like enzyme
LQPQRHAAEFRAVEANLRESFRVLTPKRPRSEVTDLPGVSIISLGVAFQMFNAAFLNAPVAGPEELLQRVETARSHFRTTGQEWSLWVCEDWLDRAARRQLPRLCQNFGLRLATEVPGMIAERLGKQSRRQAAPLEFRRVAGEATLADFTGIGTICFNVPSPWYREVFDAQLPEREFAAWVGYLDGCPVSTAASVSADGVIGLYNVATAPGYRGRGFGEAITRHTAQMALDKLPGAPLILQSSSMGVDLYFSLGFRSVTRFSVYNS